MIAIVFTAALFAAPVVPASAAIRVLAADGAPAAVEIVGPGVAQGVSTAEPVATSTPNLYQVSPRCRNLPYRVVDQEGRPVAKRLADLPGPGGLQLLVDRKVEGCRVITLKYGTVAPDQPNPPADRYQVRPLQARPDRR